MTGVCNDLQVDVHKSPDYYTIMYHIDTHCVCCIMFVVSCAFLNKDLWSEFNIFVSFNIFVLFNAMPLQ